MNTVFWFRNDLRLSDNTGLFEASKKENKIIPIYIVDETQSPKTGEASNWWLRKSLIELNNSLGGKLNIYKGNPKDIIEKIVKNNDVSSVFWNRCYDKHRIENDSKIKEYLTSSGIECKSFNASLLFEPWEILKEDKTPYKVFTHFYRNGCLNKLKNIDLPLPKTQNLNLLIDEHNEFKNIDQALPLPKIKWYEEMNGIWIIGESGAQERLNAFIASGLSDYKDGRNFPVKNNVSRLSPYLHFGEISPKQILYEIKKYEISFGADRNSDHFLSEIGWREFSYYVLYHFPHIAEKNYQEKFDYFPWINDEKLLKAWQDGMTGYPIIDAGMRELRRTGYMHNRVRMIVASFLTKNLMTHWKKGFDWFWDNLLDADIANNTASWQWVCGSGFDAAPYFRIFNNVTQGEKFDIDGEYTRYFVPELSKLPNKYLFEPYSAPSNILENANVCLGMNYPNPIIDLDFSRKRALEAFYNLKNLNKIDLNKPLLL